MGKPSATGGTLRRVLPDRPHPEDNLDYRHDDAHPGKTPTPGPAAAGNTIFRTTPPSRSRTTPASSASPHATSGCKAPVTVRHHEAPRVTVTGSRPWRPLVPDPHSVPLIVQQREVAAERHCPGRRPGPQQLLRKPACPPRWLFFGSTQLHHHLMAFWIKQRHLEQLVPARAGRGPLKDVTSSTQMLPLLRQILAQQSCRRASRRFPRAISRRPAHLGLVLPGVEVQSGQRQRSTALWHLTTKGGANEHTGVVAGVAPHNLIALAKDHQSDASAASLPATAAVDSHPLRRIRREQRRLDAKYLLRVESHEVRLRDARNQILAVDQDRDYGPVRPVRIGVETQGQRARDHFSILRIAPTRRGSGRGVRALCRRHHRPALPRGQQPTGSHLQQAAHSDAHCLTGPIPKMILITYKDDAHPSWTECR
jgi:hypothetical protein